MPLKTDEILQALDQRAKTFEFPMLDNGYIYLAAIRLSLFRSSADWALVFERFGYSPRAGMPSLDIQTFSGSRPDAGFTSVDPIEDGEWIDSDETELVADDAIEIAIRGAVRPLPRRDEYLAFAIELADPDRVQIFELCRYLAATARTEVLATDEERRIDLASNLSPLLVLDEWHPLTSLPASVQASVKRFDSSPPFSRPATVPTTGPAEHRIRTGRTGPAAALSSNHHYCLDRILTAQVHQHDRAGAARQRGDHR